MRHYVDQIPVHSYSVAYKIAAALEQDGEYSVELYDRDSYGNPLKDPVSDGAQIYTLRIFQENKLAPLPVGFAATSDSNEGETIDDAN